MKLARASLLASSIALASVVVAACTLQEPAVVDSLDPPGADTLIVSPQEAATAVDVPVTFSVPDTTALGNPVSGDVAWSATGGSIDTSGVFVADTAGTYEVLARRGGRNGHASVVVSAAPVPPPATLTGIEVSPATLSLAPGAAQQFAAIGRLSDGSTTTVTVSWAATGGSITAGGLYTAGATAGSFRVIGTRQGDTRADTSTVTITTAPATLTSIVVSPASISIAPAARQQFSAIGRNSDGSSSSVLVNWTATGGAITAGGLYTAGGDGGDVPGDRGAAGGHEGGYVERDDHGAGADLVVGRADAGDGVAGGREPRSSSPRIGRMSDGSTSAVGRHYSAHGRHGHGGGAVHGGGDGGDVPGDRGAAGRHPGRYVGRHGDGHGADADGGGSDAGECHGGGGGDAAVHRAGADERRQHHERERDLERHGRHGHAGGALHGGGDGGDVPGDRGAAGRAPGPIRRP